MGQGYRCIYRVMSPTSSEYLFFSEDNIGPLQQDIEDKTDRTIKSSIAKGKDRNTIAVEDLEKEVNTLFLPQRQSHSAYPKPDLTHCSSVSIKVWMRRN